MTRSSETLQARMQRAIEPVRRKFIDELDDKILDLEALRKMVVNGDRAQEALSEIISRAHKIRGVAGSFGLTELGDAARHIEESYMELFQSSNHDGATFAENWSILAPQLEALLDQMELALER